MVKAGIQGHRGTNPQQNGGNHVATTPKKERPAKHDFPASNKQLAETKDFAEDFRDCAILLVHKRSQIVVATSTASDYDQLFDGFKQNRLAKGEEVRDSEYMFVYGPAKLTHVAKLMDEGHDQPGFEEKTR
jgi:hypothetical protein